MTPQNQRDAENPGAASQDAAEQEEQAAHTAAPNAPTVTPEPVEQEQAPEDVGQFESQSFDPKQHYSHQTGSSNEPLAIVMMLVLGLVALGIIGVVLWLIYGFVMEL